MVPEQGNCRGGGSVAERRSTCPEVRAGEPVGLRDRAGGRRDRGRRDRARYPLQPRSAARHGERHRLHAPFRLVADRSIAAPGAAAIIKHGHTLLVASFAREGGLIRLVEHHATLRPAKHSLPHAVIHAHAGPTITLATRGSSYYIRSGTRTWKLTGHHVQRVPASKLRPAVARQLAGTPGDRRRLDRGAPEAVRRLTRRPSPSRLGRAQPAVEGRARPREQRAGRRRRLGLGHPVRDLGRREPTSPTCSASTPPAAPTAAPIALGHGIPVLALAAGGRIWVVTNTERRHSLIWQIDPSTGRALGSTPLPASFLPTVGRGTNTTLWLASNGPARRPAVPLRDAVDDRA